MSAVLKVVGLSKTFHAMGEPVEALRGVSLEVRRGEFVAIMGASGSGKSTLLHLIGGLDSPTGGTVVIDGEELGGMTDRDRTLFRRRKLGIIFQSFNLLPTLSALENVALPHTISGREGAASRLKAVSLLEMLDMGHRMHHRPQALSGGEQQRVAIARALMNDPALVLADEPTGNLDSRHSTAIWKILAKLCDETGCTVIAVTHEATGATFADRVILISDGKIADSFEPGGEGHAELVASRYAQLAG